MANFTPGPIDPPMSSTSELVKYPNPFFDLSKTYFPKDIKNLFKWCRYFFYKSAIIKNVVTKKSEYPITNLIIDTDNEDKKNLWTKILVEHLNIRPFLFYCGLDYFAMGNCIVSVVKPFRRHVICPNCKTMHLLSEIKYKWHRFKFVGKCPKCQRDGVEYIVKDIYLKDPSKLKLKRWNIENIDIEHEEVTDTYTYIYKIPNNTRKGIKKGTRTIIENIPWIFVEAVRQNHDIQLDPERIFHFKREGLSETSPQWGKPDILSALPLVFYLFILKKAQEAIGLERTVPLRVLYPKAGEGLNPYTDLNLSFWKKRVEEEVQQWKRDPNHISVMPVPLGYANIGGEAKALLLTQEIDNTQKEIVISMECTMEFVYGGASWSGSSVSLRIIENSFLNYREHGIDPLMSFIIKEVAGYLGIQTVKAKLSDFKMADDIQRKQLLYNMAKEEHLSWDTFLDNLGYDTQKEYKKILDQIDDLSEIAKKKAIAQVEVQGEATLKGTEYEARIMKAKMESQQTPHLVALQEVFQEHLRELMQMAPEARQAIVEKMKQDMPTYSSMFLEQLAAYAKVRTQQTSAVKTGADGGITGAVEPSAPFVPQAQTQGQKGSGQQDSQSQKRPDNVVDMRPNPTQLPPRRQATTL